MVNVGKYAADVIAKGPPSVSRTEGEVAILRHVVAQFQGKWLRFDTAELARKVVPPEDHHKIYSSPDELAFKLGAKRLMAVGREFGCKSTPELWAKLQTQAYDPLTKYEEMRARETAARKSRGPRVTRYKKKITYRFHFDAENNGHQQVYARLPPQACAIVDLLQELTELPERPQDRKNIFAEEELQGYVNLRKDLLHTKQDPWRIFQYYRARLISAGFLRFHHDPSKAPR